MHALQATSTAFVDHNRSGMWWAIIAHSPLRLAWGGDAAVMLFFVLSGYVLAIKPPTTWGSYYRTRLMRLYLPVWAAILVALGATMAVPRVTPDPSNWWLTRQVTTGPAQVRDAALLVNPGMWMPQLWSLKWEVAFSLLLPAYLWAFRRSSSGVALFFLVATSALGWVTHAESLTYLPIFGLGVVAATKSLKVRASRPLALVAAAALMTPWAYWLQGVGALLVVLVAVGRPPNALASPVLLWLGRISFSLYLTHLVVLWIALGVGLRGPLLAAATVAISLPTAWAFHCALERPLLRVALRQRSAHSVEVQRPDNRVAARVDRESDLVRRDVT